jgi:hypothetical protein
MGDVSLIRRHLRDSDRLVRQASEQMGEQDKDYRHVATFGRGWDSARGKPYDRTSACQAGVEVTARRKPGVSADWARRHVDVSRDGMVE